ASSVLDIKIITDPGAKYDAEGVGGIIDLITERGHKVNQTNGTITLGTSTRKENKADFNIATNQNKLTLSLSGSITQRGKQDMEMSMLTRNLSSDLTSMNTEYRGENNNKSLWGNFDLQASYEIDTLNLISINGGASNSKFDREGNMAYRMYNEIMESTNTEFTTSNSQWKDVWAGFDYQHNFRHNPQSMITFSYKFSGDMSEDPSQATGNNNGLISQRKQKNDERSSEHTFQLDYILPIDKHLTMEDGIKYIYRPKSSESQLETYYQLGEVMQAMDGMPSPSNSITSFDTDDKIAAAYAQLTGKYGKYTLKGGVRYEYTFNSVDQPESQGNSFSKKYSSTVPTASLTYNITPMQNLSVTYGMRISRPGIWFLNPFVDKSNPTSWSYGNSELTPEKYHNFSLSYGKFGMKQSLNLSVRYSTCGTGITRYSFLKDNITHNTYKNGTDNNSLTINGYYGYNFSQKTRVMMNMSANYVDLNNSETHESNHGWSGNLYGQFNQTIFWDIKASLGVMASLRRYNINGYSDGMSFGTLSFTKDFLDKKLTASVSGMCSLKDFDKMIFKNHNETSTYVSDMRFEIPMGRIQFSLTYRFGKSHVQVKKANVSIDNDDASQGKSSDVPSAGM
ncbi:MAG: outer membrane beta-barrel family protein, partial [Bacteroidales bacterium]|nr:outer membrane beta-barrel family protein [Bacteroidales bacterium]